MDKGKSGKKELKLDREWKEKDLEDKYELIEFLGEGTYG